MRELKLVISLPAVACLAMAHTPRSVQDIASPWERQIRQWIQGVSPEKPPQLLLRLYDEIEACEDLLAAYERADGRFVIALARSREVTAQSIFNLYKHEIGDPPPPVPIDLKIKILDRKAFSSLLESAKEFLRSKPKSWEQLVMSGHAGSIYASVEGGEDHVFEGPIRTKSDPTVANLFQRLKQTLEVVRGGKGYKVYEFPTNEKVTQWRFNRALMNGDETLAIYLLSLGANPNKDPHFFESPLEQAIVRGHKLLFEDLLKHGADTKAMTSSGISLEEFARKNNATWALSLLKEH